MGYPFTWIKRASPEEMERMLSWIESDNELAGENDDIMPKESRSPVYSLRRGGDSWTVVCTWKDGSEDIGSFVRCRCGHIQERWEGQVEACDECGEEW